jgi:hypothetical protein
MDYRPFSGVGYNVWAWKSKIVATWSVHECNSIVVLAMINAGI